MQPQTPADRPERNRENGNSEVIFESGALQFFEDHDTRGDPRYPQVKQPRDVPRSIEDWRRRHNR